MVTIEEIERVARLMKIDLDDHVVHIERVKKMIDYFDILDRAGVEDEGLPGHDLHISELRQDEFVPYEGDLIKHIKNYKGRYVRAPKMI